MRGSQLAKSTMVASKGRRRCNSYWPSFFLPTTSVRRSRTFDFGSSTVESANTFRFELRETVMAKFVPGVIRGRFGLEEMSVQELFLVGVRTLAVEVFSLVVCSTFSSLPIEDI